MFSIIDRDGEECAVLNPEYRKKVAKQKYNLLLERSGIPEFYWDIEFSDYKGDDSRDNLNKAIHYAENISDPKFNHIHLYCYGNNNAQKTAVACNVGKEIIKQGLSVKFILAGNLIDKLIKVQGYTINEDIEYELKRIRNSNVVIIDDIFDTNKSILWKNPDSASLVLTAWDNFLRDLVASKVKIILTSNIPTDTINKKFGESIYHLIDRNFISLGFYDDIKTFRKKKFDNLFE